MLRKALFLKDFWWYKILNLLKVAYSFSRRFRLTLIDKKRQNKEKQLSVWIFLVLDKMALKCTQYLHT